MTVQNPFAGGRLQVAVRRSAARCMLALLGQAAAAGFVQGATPELWDLSLEELAKVEITSVSRRPERLDRAAASVYVITGDAIRRAGATSLAEALRLAPNLQVARIDASQYAISARGFNNAIGNKLLVMVDGRTVYAPSFSGVYWDQQDLMLEDVERIEVISGPGATLWGVNAVNGVINVTTRSAASTPGDLVSVGGGNTRTDAAWRHGGELGDNGHYRFYGKTTRTRHTETAAGAPVRDAMDRAQVGFRADWQGKAGNFTLQGDAYRSESDSRGSLGTFEIGALATSGVNVLGRWTRALGEGSDLRVQAYFDRSKREDRILYQPATDIIDIEMQHALRLGAHRWVWGGGHRRADDDIQPGYFFAFIPSSRVSHWTNVFLQDTVALNRQLELILGLKLERNDYTGTEHLPNLRLAWQPMDDHLLWASTSRAVRAPARLDRELYLPPNPPYIIAGGPDFVSEVAKVYEIGYRAQPSADSSLSVTAFRHAWDRLRSGQPPPGAQVQNMIEGFTDGLEAWAGWQPTPNWRLSGGLTLLRQRLKVKAGSTDPVGPSSLGNDPRHQWSIRSSFNLPNRQEFDVAVRRVAALPQPAVPAYVALDLRYAWLPRPDLEMSLSARNLLDASHAEFGNAADRSEIGRSVLLRLRWTP